MSTVSSLEGQSSNSGNASDWNLGSVPNLNEEVIVGASGAYTIAITGAASSGNLVFDASGATLAETSGSLDINGVFGLYAGNVPLVGNNSIVLVRVRGRPHPPQVMEQT
jgi:hypothetical protein